MAYELVLNVPCLATVLQSSTSVLCILFCTHCTDTFQHMLSPAGQGHCCRHLPHILTPAGAVCIATAGMWRNSPELSSVGVASPSSMALAGRPSDTT